MTKDLIDDLNDGGGDGEEGAASDFEGNEWEDFVSDEEDMALVEELVERFNGADSSDGASSRHGSDISSVASVNSNDTTDASYVTDCVDERGDDSPDEPARTSNLHGGSSTSNKKFQTLLTAENLVNLREPQVPSEFSKLISTPESVHKFDGDNILFGPHDWFEP